MKITKRVITIDVEENGTTITFYRSNNMYFVSSALINNKQLKWNRFTYNKLGRGLLTKEELKTVIDLTKRAIKELNNNNIITTYNNI